eukprot:8733818-Lingulodinium_polyedra.AAC.1
MCQRLRVQEGRAQASKRMRPARCFFTRLQSEVLSKATRSPLPTCGGWLGICASTSAPRQTSTT